MQKETVQTTENRPFRLNTSHTVAALRKEVAINPVFSNVCHVFALRERARQQVTLASLRLRMIQEGFSHSKEDYIKVLKFLASIGIGTLEVGKDKEPIALKNIKHTLQSVGKAAITTSDKLEFFTPQFDFQKLPLPTVAPAPVVKPAAAEAAPVPTASPVTLALTAWIDGKPVVFKLPHSLTTDQLGEVLADLFSHRSNS